MKRLLLLSFFFSLFAISTKAQMLSCTDLSMVDANYTCPIVADSVWGCNGNCYLNPCEALHHFGVTSYTYNTCNVSPAACEAVLSANDFAGVINFDGGLSTTASGGMTYVFDFGDGDTSHSGAPAHFYTNPGFYTVCLTITDSDPNFACSSTSCIVIVSSGGGACTPLFSAETNCGVTTFTDLSSPAGYSYGEWDMGDLTTGNYPPGNFAYSYAAAGTYTVHFQMIDTLTQCSQGYSTDIVVTLPTVQSNFTYVASGSGTHTVTFTNTSTGATSYWWDFGDGDTSTLANPVHDFDTCSYTVTLIAKDANGCLSQTITLIDACGNGIPTYTSVLNSLSVYPNPAKENINVVLNSRKASDVTLTVKDVTGRNVVESTPIHINSGKNNYNLKLPSLSAGVYMIQVNDDLGMMNARVLIK